MPPFPAGLEPLAAPPPSVDAAAAREALRRHYGLAARLSPLPGERDGNMLVEADDGRRAVLKVHAAAEAPEVRALGRAVLVHLEDRPLPFAVPRLLRTREGAECCRVGGAEATLVAFVPGRPWGAHPPGAALRRAVGGAAAALGGALAGFDPPALRRTLPWDVMALGRLAPAAAALADRRRGGRLAALMARFDAEVAPAAAALPAGAVHNDLNGSNVLLGAGGDGVAGVIDFGDLLRAPRAVEIAVAANYGGGAADLAGAAADVAEGYARAAPPGAAPLARAEAELVYDLALGRLALRCLVYAWRAARAPARGPAAGDADAAFAALERAPPPAAGRARVLDRLGAAGALP